MSHSPSRFREVVSVEQAEHNIHLGRFHTTGYLDQAVAASGTVEVLFRVPSSTVVHAQFTGTVSADAIGELFEGPTTSADGTSLPIHARNRDRAEATAVLSFHTPTVSADGTQLIEFFIPGGSGGSASGAIASPFEEWILGAGDYLLRLTNLGGNNQILGIAIDYYQPDRRPRI